ncbi:MAG TPA: L-histidine N(alpha)-methyltransferase [Sandaracinaceae bacterium LLY-WYZ-13_1]|nr:L-histidine N(alpha)-methyltransferase [Sandaracinaceae bacterium LLY-WYZ-13_1]
MSNGYTVLGPQTVQDLHDPVRDFAYDVLVGLSEKPKRLSSKYFYDDEGSRLFSRIMRLPEYYPTDCETEILEANADAIVAPLIGDAPFNLVDLGAGDGKKTMILLEALRRAGADFTFVPIDISEGAMKQLVGSIRQRMPDVRVEGLVSEYADGVHYLGREHRDRRNLVLFLGSNVGNFNAVQARAFLRRLWSSLGQGDYALVGFDLKKDIEVLLAAYNDAQGVTAAFNLNLLTRMNRELGADFAVDKFRHFGTYNVFSGAMESYLVSLEPQLVRIESLETSFAFDAWEPVHTEYSYKYLRSDVERLAEDTGFDPVHTFEDERGWFSDALWRVRHAPEVPEPRG